MKLLTANSRHLPSLSEPVGGMTELHRRVLDQHRIGLSENEYDITFYHSQLSTHHCWWLYSMHLRMWRHKWNDLALLIFCPWSPRRIMKRPNLSNGSSSHHKAELRVYPDTGWISLHHLLPSPPVTTPLYSCRGPTCRLIHSSTQSMMELTYLLDAENPFISQILHLYRVSGFYWPMSQHYLQLMRITVEDSITFIARVTSPWRTHSSPYFCHSNVLLNDVVVYQSFVDIFVCSYIRF